MLAQFMQGFGSCAPSTSRSLFRQFFHGAVHSYAPHFVNIADIGVYRAVLYIGSETSNGRFDHHPIFGMRANFAGQGQELNGLFKSQIIQGPALRNGHPRWLGDLLRHSAALHIGAISPIAQADGICAIMSQQLAIGTDRAAFGARWSKRTGKAAFWVVGTANKCAAGSGCAHGQASIATAFAYAWINPGLFNRKEMRFKDIINFFKNFGDGLIHRLVDRDLEILPKTAQYRAVLAITCGDIIQLIFQIGREFIAHILAEETAEEHGDQTPLIFRNQPIFLFAHIVAILDRGDD